MLFTAITCLVVALIGLIVAPLVQKQEAGQPLPVSGCLILVPSIIIGVAGLILLIIAVILGV